MAEVGANTLWGGCYDHEQPSDACIECKETLLAQAQARIRELELALRQMTELRDLELEFKDIALSELDGSEKQLAQAQARVRELDQFVDDVAAWCFEILGPKEQPDLGDTRAVMHSMARAAEVMLARRAAKGGG